GRHTGVTLEPRAVVADWNAAEARLTIYQGSQAPHMVQNIAALHLGLEEQQVRVVCKAKMQRCNILHHVRRLTALIDCKPCLGRVPVSHDRTRLEGNTGVSSEHKICFHHLISASKGLINSAGLVHALESEIISQ